MSISIIDLPRDIVRLIPMPYRSWQRLRMTCHALDITLGDYHKARGLHVLDANNKKVPYALLVKDVVNQMATYGTSIGSYTICNDVVYRFAMAKGAAAWPYDSAFRIKWYTEDYILQIDDGYHEYSLEQISDRNHNDWDLMVDSVKYVVTGSTSVTDVCRYIYNDLPGLFKYIRIIKRMMASDLE